MTFVFWAALAITGLVVGPIVAHMLRRGRAREREFPAAALVPPRTSTARERSRLEDWPLLVLRALMITGLAVLGAAPLVRCERLSLARTAGGSVAFVVVLDDSLSMRAQVNGTSRFELAREGAEQLLRSARDGDSVAVVLAGKPARIALSPTTDLSAATRIVNELTVSDRSTDLGAAVQLARSAVHSLPQQDHRVVVLSDFAGEELPPGVPAVTAPLADLTASAPDCGIAGAERHGTRVIVNVACNDEAAARSRAVELKAGKQADDGRSARNAARAKADAGPASRAPNPGDVIGSAPLSPRRGEQTLSFQVPAAAAALDVRLSGADAMNHDDTAPVAEEATAPAVAVVADAEGASARTGGPTVVEQALQALTDTWVVRPLPFVPDDENGLKSVAALILDDPRGLSPEARGAVVRFLEHGGVAAALLGPGASATELGWNLEPFARGAARWEPLGEPGSSTLDIDVASLGWLGPEAASLAHFGKRGRVRLDGLGYDDSRTLGKWSDGIPWIHERDVGRGLAVTVGVPSSLEESDLAVRPGFLALLEHVLHQADQRKGSRRTIAGVPWFFPGAKNVAIEGPEGPLTTTSARRDPACDAAVAGCNETELTALPVVRGRYLARIDGAAETRTVTMDPAEILADPRPTQGSAAAAQATGTAYVAASREVALALVALFGAELAVRLVRRWMRRGGQSAASDLARTT